MHVLRISREVLCFELAAMIKGLLTLLKAVLHLQKENVHLYLTRGKEEPVAKQVET